MLASYRHEIEMMVANRGSKLFYIEKTPRGRSLDEAFIKAAGRGDTPHVTSYLARGADVNAKNSEGWTALTWAAAGGHTEIVQILLAKGANVKPRGVYDRTALQWAKAEGHKDIVKLLKKAGAKE